MNSEFNEAKSSSVATFCNDANEGNDWKPYSEENLVIG